MNRYRFSQGLRMSALFVITTTAQWASAQEPTPIGISGKTGGASSQYRPNASPTSPTTDSTGMGQLPTLPSSTTSPGTSTNDATANSVEGALSTSNAAPTSTPATNPLDSALSTNALGSGDAHTAFVNPTMLGDAPASRFRLLTPSIRSFATLPTPTPPAPGHPSPNNVPQGAIQSIRGIKISENQSPLPQDRVFFSFNYFNNIGSIYNKRDNNGVNQLTAYQYTLGFEKTFLQGDASFGFRAPINVLTVDSNQIRNNGTFNSVGSLNFFVKKILADTTWSDGRRFVLTGGLNLTMPTGPRSFAGAPNVYGLRSTFIQPFVGYYYADKKFYFQGFTAIETPVGTGDKDVTFFYEDLNVGYYLLDRRTDESKFLRAIIPAFETHINIPLNHSGYKPYTEDPVSTPPVVNFTYTVNFLFNSRSLLTFGYVSPVTGPRMFSGEAVVQFNYFFGGRRAGLTGTPAVPLAGN